MVRLGMTEAPRLRRRQLEAFAAKMAPGMLVHDYKMEVTIPEPQFYALCELIYLAGVSAGMEYLESTPA
jgi:hypothetical protein